ncbi:winged helix-turn-helix domain-containing protein [uncultured Polaribacter sp.]|uniref:winged helix-turn-helix domain-containing protein n=1 Tax=uncultured Polaribacter sp. TaxID=174711 RepID=UPI00259B065A|nr:winged helix-turn-helix domain-containing protein [uncultured Polaribacter sp.]
MNKKEVVSGIFLIVLVFVLWSFYPQENDKNDFSEKIKITLRQVGNQLLLFNQDSTSLVLPIKELETDKFQISFQKELSFEPSVLVAIVKLNLEKSAVAENYRVEVIECLNNEVSYSYEINADEEKTIIPCAGRVLPENCYTIQIKFLQKNNPKSSNRYLLYIFIPILLGIVYRKYSDKKSNVLKDDSKDSKTVLGSFIFYPEQNKLVKKAKEIALSKKECELLEIFIANANQVVKREELTKRVWEDNGVIVGRSLDTYISKLRKKLQEDDAIKLTNIHGVGYKLEIN